MQFHDFEKELKSNFALLTASHEGGFQTNADKDRLWEIYLESFPPARNRIYKTRREFDCSCCRHFVKEIGGIVFVDDALNKRTIWGYRVEDPDFQVVLDALDEYVKSCDITAPYISKFGSVGTKQTHDYSDGTVITWEHFYVELPDEMTYRGRDTLNTIISQKCDTAHVFGRSLAEITLDAIDTVLDLVNSNTLYKGAEWQRELNNLRKYKVEYDALPEDKKPLYVWLKSKTAGPVLGRIRNHSIGVLLVDVSNGVDLNEAVTRYERIVAPTNYKRPKAIFTAKMLEDAKKTITELGYMDSLPRRYARLDDITVNNILFSNRDASRRIKGGDVFDNMLADVKSSPKKFDRVEEISIDKFVSDILPGTKELEAYVENKHSANMVSLIAPVNPEAPSMFKWGNPFSWAYTGNMTDSEIRKNVKNAGGNVDGVLRFSIQWNDTGELSRNDLDAHCIEPDEGSHIFFGYKHSGRTEGELDVDIIHPIKGVPAVENIVWPNKRRMVPGDYRFFVHQYSNRGGRDGFRAEIVFDGQTFSFDYPHELRQNENVDVATVTLNRDGSFSINTHLPATTASKDLWGIKTNSFVPVTVVMFSPNYWDEKGIGNKHYMFMLKDCVNPEKPNGFYNEFLKQELADHKRVFEALGNKMAVELVDDQLSGLGFSSTQRNELVVKVKGATERVMKIKF